MPMLWLSAPTEIPSTPILRCMSNRPSDLSPHSGFKQLFDHRKDPGECVNIAARVENQGRISLMTEVLRERLLHLYRPTVGRVGLW